MRYSHLVGLSLFSFFGPGLASASVGSDENTTPRSTSFHPASFPKNTVKCKAINRKDNEEKDIEIRKPYFGYSLSLAYDLSLPGYVELNPSAERTIIMVHGWPGLWSNWAHQILEFQVCSHLSCPILL